MVNLGKNKVPFSYPSMISLSSLLFLLLQPLFTTHVNSYRPADNFAVTCGHSGTFPIHGRTWVGDINSNLFSLTEPQTVQPSKIANSHPPPSVNSVPFGSARLSHLEFSYSFPLANNGPVFLRLHFYPTSYDKFQPFNSLFSVKVGTFTLLKDFNASLWVVNGGEETISKEYIINVERGQRLNITFLPSTNHSDACYAFINGIEVVSMPPFLYYSNPDDQGFELVGQTTRYGIQNNKALETLYRINVGGGKQISPNEDTGMFRKWDNDVVYLESPRPHSVSSGFGLKLNYKDGLVPNYFAPDNVYLTAQNYEKSQTANYNVTWWFDVDSEFYYMVRLHFCEFEKEIQNVGDRVFQIFIAESLAEDGADVISWSRVNLVPVHKDYAVSFISQGISPKKIKLSIKLQRLPLDRTTKYLNVILNGIEIFKINDQNNNLAGPNPDPVPPPPPVLALPLIPPSKNSNKTTKIILVVSAVFSLMLVISVLGFIIFRKRRRGVDDKKEGNSKRSRTPGSSSLPSDLCRYFTINEIKAATNNFDDVFLIGVGGFGNVYKGFIDDRATPVAIKRLKPGSQQGVNEFMNEIEMLSQLRHLHLVSLIGYCNDGAEMILVYDFMQRGTLREYLYDSDNDPLQWKQRLEILLGAARGLHYLHAGAKHNIIHRDVKSTNILLDEKWVAKVSDFGLSRVGPTGTSMTHVSTVVKGSLGYLDPEYYKRQRLTLKSDVYSFGVVLLEVLCARPPLVRTVDKQKASLVEWVKKCHDQGKLDQTVDPFLRGTLSPECLKSYSHVALSCLVDDGNQRPSMSDVVGALEFALQLVESEEDKKKFGETQLEGKSEERPLLPQLLSGGESDVRFTSSDESGSKSSNGTTVSASSEEQALVPALVFSEIGDPRAR